MCSCILIEALFLSYFNKDEYIKLWVPITGWGIKGKFRNTSRGLLFLFISSSAYQLLGQRLQSKCVSQENQDPRLQF